jgi:hypothetical protein
LGCILAVIKVNDWSVSVFHMAVPRSYATPWCAFATRKVGKVKKGFNVEGVDAEQALRLCVERIEGGWV